MMIKKGDVVRIKSGGPQMTVEEYPVQLLPDGEDTERAKCVWFDDKKLLSCVFCVSSLEIDSD